MSDLYEYRVFGRTLYQTEREFDERRMFPGIEAAWDYVIERTENRVFHEIGVYGLEI